MKVIFIYQRGYVSEFPDEENDAYWISGHTGMIARQLAERIRKINFESWRIDSNTKVYKEKKVRGVSCKIFPGVKIPIIGDFSFRMIRRINKECDNNKVIIHLGSLYNFKWVLLKILLPGKKIVASQFGDRPSKVEDLPFIKKIKRIVKNWITKKVFIKRLDHCFVASILKMKYLINLHLKSQKISFPEIGTDTKLFFPIDKKLAREQLNLPVNIKIIFYIGRFKEGKGTKEILNIFPKIRQNYPGAKLIMIGGRPGDRYWKKASEMKDTILLGLTKYTLLPLYHNAADVFIRLDFLDEGPFSVGTNVFEALCCNTPVVSTTLKHLPAYIKNISKIGICPKSDRDIYSALKNIMDNPDDFKDCSKAIRKIYSWDNLGEKFASVYLNIFNNM